MKAHSTMVKNLDAQQRPILDPLLHDFVIALREQRPQHFGHLDPRNLLFVAGSARREARASIRPFAALRPVGPRRPTVQVQGQRILYEICLRPLFFLDVTAPQRTRILAHELWHIDPLFDGRLAEERRHGRCPPDEFEAKLQDALGDFDPTDTALWSVLSSRGERRLAAWKRRPPSILPDTSTDRDEYDEGDLFSAVVVQL